MGTWTLVQPMINGHNELAAATLEFGGALLPPFVRGPHTFAIGGTGLPNDVEEYNQNLRNGIYQWFSGPAIPTPRFGHAAGLGSPYSIFVIGGRSSSLVLLNTVEVLYFPTGEPFFTPGPPAWTAVQPMITARERLAAATAPDGRVFAIGGSNGAAPYSTSPVNTVEVYNAGANTWTTVSPMSSARDGLAATTGPDGHIYAIGGVDGGKSMNSVEAYNPVTGVWKTVAPMKTARDGLAAVTGLDGLIYAIGGETNGQVLNTVEAYDPKTNTWTAVASMTTPRTGLAATVRPDGTILAIGGFDGLHPPLATVESFSK